MPSRYRCRTATRTRYWSGKERAHAEVARVLRPAGTFAPIWNMRDDRVDWVVELGRIAHLGDSADTLVGKLTDFGPAFDAIELGEFGHRTALAPEQVIELVHTRSYYLTAERRQRDRVDRELWELFAGHPDLTGRQTVELPYRTFVFRARRR
ncbi:hypothetical protein ACFQ0D_18040 [Micromonospora zhanjiangensis]